MKLKLITLLALSISSASGSNWFSSSQKQVPLAQLSNDELLKERIDHAERLVEDHKRHLTAIDARLNALEQRLPANGFFMQPRIESLERAIQDLSRKLENQEKRTSENRLSIDAIANIVIQLQTNFDELKESVGKLTAPHFVEQRPARSIPVDSFDIDRERIRPFIDNSIERALKSSQLIDRTHFMPTARLVLELDTELRLLRAHVEQLQQVIQRQQDVAAAGAIRMRQLTAARPKQSHKRNNSAS